MSDQEPTLEYSVWKHRYDQIIDPHTLESKTLKDYAESQARWVWQSHPTKPEEGAEELIERNRILNAKMAPIGVFRGESSP